MTLASDQWIKDPKDCWIAFFDILGFKKMIDIDNDYILYYVKTSYETTLSELKKSCNGYETGDLNYSWFSDSFVIYTNDNSGKGYSEITDAAKMFISSCIKIRIPIRGAISVGPLHMTNDGRTLIGKCFFDAYEYCEDQDWLGLLLTPTAITMAESYGLLPIRNNFIQKNIPMKQKNIEAVMAYTFCDSPGNDENPLLPILNEMMQEAVCEKNKNKYRRTIDFIKANHRRL
jgi:hypothetical protein